MSSEQSQSHGETRTPSSFGGVLVLWGIVAVLLGVSVARTRLKEGAIIATMGVACIGFTALLEVAYLRGDGND